MNYLQDQAVMVFPDSGARGSAIGTAVSDGMVSYIADSGTVEVYHTVGTAVGGWVNVASVATDSYRYATTLYFTSSGTFSKADYPWLRAIKVTAQGAGGAGSSASFPFGGHGGGAGSCAISFITDISSLAASVTVTVGAGGIGVASNVGSDGGNSSFGSLVRGDGGNAGTNSDGGGAKTTGLGDLVIEGGGAGCGSRDVTFSASRPSFAGVGGNSFLGNGGRAGGPSAVNTAGNTGGKYGGGGAGARNPSGTVAGGDGAPGIVIIELYA
jgi:hypothetical protein